MKTTCPYCGVGCGLEITTKVGGEFEIRGDESHPANYGRLCSKASALGETLSLDDRLLHPQVNGESTSWDNALETVANRFSRTIEQHGPDSVAFYVSGQLLTEDYYVVNKLAKGFVGTANIDTNSRLCMASSVAAHKRAFGSDTVPGSYEDFELADLVILTGSNTAWCHAVLYQRLVAEKKARPELKIVVIDPRRTATCDIADLHLAIKPGSDSILFNGLLQYLSRHEAVDTTFVQQHTDGFQQAVDQAAWFAPNTEAVAQHCALEVEKVDRFYRWFTEIKKALTVYSQGINQSSSGTDKANSIINCHLMTGRIGKPGMGPFSVTGQPNAMGGREVGALANQLASHMDFNQADVDRVGRFWQTDNMAYKPGLKAIELFEAVHSGKIKALWVIATNPAVSMPNATQVRDALKKCEFTVVSDCVRQTDTSIYADVHFPALAWGEKDGTVTNSERRISRQKRFLPAPGEALADWLILSRFAQKMGYSGFDYTGSHQIFLEHAALSAFENQQSRQFNLSGLTDLTQKAYDNLQPVQWPIVKPHTDGQARIFTDGRFQTDNGRAKFVAITPRPPVKVVDSSYPWVLNTGRERDQWHSMTRTGKSPRLNGHVSEPMLQINPLDALGLNISNGQLLRVSSRYASMVLRANLNEQQQRGQLFAPMHWNDQFCSGGCIDKLVNPYQDPVSGQPEFKYTAVSLEVFKAGWHGFVLSKDQIDTSIADYWVKSRGDRLWHYELAGIEGQQSWAEFARRLLNVDRCQAEWGELMDSTQSNYRAARFIAGKLNACIFISTSADLPARDWLMRLFAETEITAEQRLRILAGKPASGEEDKGRIICACFSVGANTLRRCIRDTEASTTEQLGQQLQAGTNCGSCLPELRQLISECRG